MSEDKESVPEASEQPNETEPEAAPKNPLGRVEWLDLTVHDGRRLRDFYSEVVGWKAADVDMGMYSDYNMNLPESGETIAGICHARGQNAGLPSQWLVYVRVASVHEAAETCRQKGGEVLDGPKRMGSSDICVIKDPAGAVMALLSDRKPNPA
jgi:predicted enzyme related to lactoylglutathione lyase